MFVGDGRMPIDNNEVEQLMKQVALGRKNWLFLGSVEAGNRAATLLTIISTAVRNDLDVWAYVKDVLDQLLGGSTDYHSLTGGCLEAIASRVCPHLSGGRASRRRRPPPLPPRPASARRALQRRQISAPSPRPSPMPDLSLVNGYPDVSPVDPREPGRDQKVIPFIRI